MAEAAGDQQGGVFADGGADQRGAFVSPLDPDDTRAADTLATEIVGQPFRRGGDAEGRVETFLVLNDGDTGRPAQQGQGRADGPAGLQAAVPGDGGGATERRRP